MDKLIADHKRGTTWDGISFLFEEPQPNGTYLPTNLTGVKIIIDFLWVKNGEPVFSFSTLDGTITIPNPLNGVVFMQSRLITVPENRYMFDVKLTLANGDIKEPISDYWTIIS